MLQFMNTTGKRVRLLRLEGGITQGELANRAGIRQSYLSEIESDRGRPTGEIIAALARALNTSSDFLLLLSDEPGFATESEPVHA